MLTIQDIQALMPHRHVTESEALDVLDCLDEDSDESWTQADHVAVAREYLSEVLAERPATVYEQWAADDDARDEW